MLTEYEIGNVPFRERSIAYTKTNVMNMVHECIAFKSQIQKHYPPPVGCRLIIREIPRQNEKKYIVCAVFDNKIETNTKWISDIEHDMYAKLMYWN